MIRALVVFLFLGLAVFLGLPWLILWSWVAGSPDLMYSAATQVARMANWLAGMRVRVEGVENIPAGACVFAANHTSNLDPLALLPAIPRRVSFLAKREVFRVPVLGPAMRVAQFISVDRANREAASASVDAAIRSLKAGLSFMVFPEGTRSPDGRVRPFKKGTFVMAIEAGVPVVPVSIAGAQNLMQKGSRAIHPGRVTIRFGVPVDTSQYSSEHRGELLARVEARVAAGLPVEQQPDGGPREANSAAEE